MLNTRNIRFITCNNKQIHFRCVCTIVKSFCIYYYYYFFIIINIIILGISFIQGIYTYIPETNHVPTEYCVATILM